jgi:hypothetical protein
VSDPIFGYLDPGTGSMLLQLILGGFAGLVVALKLFGRRIFSGLTFWRKRAPDQADAKADASPKTGSS